MVSKQPSDPECEKKLGRGLKILEEMGTSWIGNGRRRGGDEDVLIHRSSPGQETWLETHLQDVYMKAQIRLYFLRKLRSFQCLQQDAAKFVVEGDLLCNHVPG